MSEKQIKILKEQITKIKIKILTLCKIKKNQSIKKSFDQLDKIEKLHHKLNELNDEIVELKQKLKSRKGSRKKSRKGSKKRTIKRKISQKKLLNCYCSK